MLNCNSALLAIASEFVGKFAPYQSIEITPAPTGGVYIASTDNGKVACLAHDPSGEGDESIILLPNSDLIKASRGVKTAERSISINGNMAMVTTHRKSTSESKEIPFHRSTSDFPKLSGAIKDCIARWDEIGKSSATAGRYDITYLQRAIKSLSSINSSVTLHSFDGGPMRIQESSGNIVILVMPQIALPIPPVPDWLRQYSQGAPSVV